MAESTRKARVPQAERTATMRSRLARAAFEVIKENGFANFRTSAVAKQAGVSQGAQLHHYRTKNDLTLAAMEYAYERSQRIFMSNISKFTAQDDPVEAVLQDAEDFYFSDYFLVALDILMAGGKNEELREQQINLAINSRSAVEHAWVEKLQSLGWGQTEAEDILNISFCIARGYAIKLLITDDMSAYRQMIIRWKKLVTHLISN